MSLFLEEIHYLLHVTMMNLTMAIFNAMMGPLRAFAPANIVDPNIDDNNSVAVVCCEHLFVCSAKMVGRVKLVVVFDGWSTTT